MKSKLKLLCTVWLLILVCVPHNKLESQELPDTPRLQRQYVKTFDRNFKIHESIMLASLAADGITTSIALKNGCEEAGPFMGLHPSNKDIAINLIPQAAVATLFNWILYRRTKIKIDRWVTFLPNDTLAVSHLVGVTMNATNGCLSGKLKY